MVNMKLIWLNMDISNDMGILTIDMGINIVICNDGMVISMIVNTHISWLWVLDDIYEYVYYGYWWLLYWYGYYL